MKLKTYAAKNLTEALAQVKKELGSEAVILSTQKRWIKEGAFSLQTHPGVEVTAAIDSNPPSSKESSDFHNAGRDFRSFSSPQNNPLELSGIHPVHPGLRQWQTEWQELKGLVLQLVRHSSPPAWLLDFSELAIFYRFLLKTGVDEKFLNHWLKDIKFRLAKPDNNGRNWRELALGPLMSAFEVLNPWPEDQTEMQVWTFIGPTGVGKTTTLVKLAARFSLGEKKNVGIITLDNYRLGAQSQIEAYARLMGMPLVCATNRLELVRTLENFTDRDLVLIDTVGRSPNHPNFISELRDWFGGLAGLRHHLILSATAREADLANAINNFGILPITSYVITKLDEASDFSGIFNLVCRHRTPISYLSTGQKVPQDLELASKRRVAELLLNSPSLCRSECGPAGEIL